MKFVEVTADSRNNIGISAWRKYGFREIRKTMKLNL
jgi:hypothetical protein